MSTRSLTPRPQKTYYPTAWSKVRATETSLNIPTTSRLSIQMMDQKWGSGDPKQYLSDLYLAAYDDHQYVKYAGVAETQSAYLAYSCGDNRSGNWPVFVGEWSLSVATDVEWTDGWNPNNAANKAFYNKWWAAQVMAYEKTAQGWVRLSLSSPLFLFAGPVDPFSIRSASETNMRIRYSGPGKRPAL